MATQTEVQKLSASEQRFVNFMSRSNDLDVAAEQAKISRKEADRLYKRVPVFNAIRRKQELVERESARLTAKATSVTLELIDNELLRTIKGDAHGMVKLRAMELGYRRIGMIRENEFVLPNMGTHQQPEGGQEDKPQSGPSFYRAFESRTTTTVHEVRELHAPVAPVVKSPDAPARVAPRRSGGPAIGLAD